MKTLATATSAGMGGFAASVILYPLDTLKTRMQAQSKKSESDKKGRTPLVTCDLESILSLYTGVVYKAAQSTISKFLYFYAYTSMSNLLLTNGTETLSTGLNLIVGYLAELMHLPMTLPLEVVVTRMQTSKRGDVGKSFISLLKTIWDENQGKLSAFYKGLSAYFVLCMQPAIQFTVFEQVKKVYLKHYKPSLYTLSAIEVSIYT